MSFADLFTRNTAVRIAATVVFVAVWATLGYVLGWSLDRGPHGAMRGAYCGAVVVP